MLKETVVFSGKYGVNKDGRNFSETNRLPLSCFREQIVRKNFRLKSERVERNTVPCQTGDLAISVEAYGDESRADLTCRWTNLNRRVCFSETTAPHIASFRPHIARSSQGNDQVRAREFLFGLNGTRRRIKTRATG